MIKKINTSFEIKPSLVVLTFFSIYFVCGLFVVPDYGISWDESAERMHGFISGNYILEKILPTDLYSKLLNQTINTKFSHLENIEIPKLLEHSDRAYGVFLELPLAFLETLIKFEEIKNVYLFRHYVIFIIFYISIIYFYKYLNFFFKNKYLALIGCISLILCPRIFSQSFYNSKDIIFLSFFIFSNYYGFLFLKNKTIKNSIIFSFFIAALISFRIIGIIVPLLFVILFLFEFIYNKKNINYLKIFILTLFFTIIFTYITWPFLWENPFNNFIYIFKFFAEKAHPMQLLYLGEKVWSNNLPWHYLIVWIYVTTPIHIIFFSLIGIIILIYNFIFIKNLFKEILNFHIFLILLIYIFFPILMFVILKPEIYSGWRHFYFLLPSIILFSIFALNFIIIKLKSKNIKILLLLFYLVGMVTNINWIITNHPYQYIYFNNFFSNKKLINYFERDYWGLSNKDLIEYINKTQKDGKIYYKFNYDGSNFYLSLKRLNKIDRDKFINFSKMPKDQKYYYYFYNNVNNQSFNTNKKFEKIKEIKLYNEVINGVYKIYLN